MAAEENQFVAGLSIPTFTCAVVYGFNRAFDVGSKGQSHQSGLTEISLALCRKRPLLSSGTLTPT